MPRLMFALRDASIIYAAQLLNGRRIIVPPVTRKSTHFARAYDYHKKCMPL